MLDIERNMIVNDLRLTLSVNVEHNLPHERLLQMWESKQEEWEVLPRVPQEIHSDMEKNSPITRCCEDENELPSLRQDILKAWQDTKKALRKMRKQGITDASHGLQQAIESCMGLQTVPFGYSP